MDLLQLALVFLIMLISVFLTIMGIQVFLILRDLKKALDRLNGVLETGEEIAKDIERPIANATEAITKVESGIKTAVDLASILKSPKPQKPKFYKRSLKTPS